MLKFYITINCNYPPSTIKSFVIFFYVELGWSRVLLLNRLASLSVVFNGEIQDSIPYLPL